MKKIKTLIITFLLTFIIFPGFIKAATFLEASTQRPVVGSDVYVLLSAMYGNYEIRELYVRIKYDPSYFEFEKTYWIQSSGSAEVKDGYIYIKKPNNGKNWTSGNQMQFKFKVLKTGVSKFEIDAVDENGHVVESYYTNGDPIAQSFANVTINAVEPSKNTLLSALYVDGFALNPTFSKTTYDYTLTVPANITELNITAKKGEEHQTITGTGKRKLEYGENRVRVVVSAQDGSQTTYQIMIMRTDDRTGDTSLKSLSVSNTNITYEKDKYEYSATVSKSVDSVLIAAVPTDSKATLTGTGKQKLEMGENVFTLDITSSIGKSTHYTIRITRSNEEITDLIKSSKLESLKINSSPIDITEKTTILYSVTNDINELNIVAVPESTTSKVDIIGNQNLKTGLNLINITVTETNNEKTDYQIIVYKYPNNVNIITDVNTIFGNDSLYTTSKPEEHIVPSYVIENLRRSNLSLYYNVVDDSNSLLYQLILGNNLPSEDTDVSFTKTADNSLTYETKLPAKVEVLLYLDGKYVNGNIVRIYSYNTAGNYTLITDGVLVNNGYVSFVTDGSSHYIITTTDLLSNQNFFMKILNQYGIYIGIGVVALLLIIVVSKAKKKKNKKEAPKEEEPLY